MEKERFYKSIKTFQVYKPKAGQLEVAVTSNCHCISFLPDQSPTQLAGNATVNGMWTLRKGGGWQCMANTHPNIIDTHIYNLQFESATLGKITVCREWLVECTREEFNNVQDLKNERK